MFELEQICPYTGLRSFTEEESLYFKGREDDIDQATEQLQRNKFLMLTGASGDGKSSLIYAGIIPNARAGFLKSKYTQWCVADFRPERTPFKNLCKSIARQLDIPNVHTVQAELNHGFSAVVDLYKSSKRYIDTNSVAWQSADEKGRAALKREAANLIILVDQFEEFFTNPENYHRGVPSTDANLVLNLLLETAQIALEEDLPIYIVFTMRSDYIGQCAAFRGLPEYIGFSQFFVPRLNRTQLQQVIEEPAVLSGNRITRRLTERLIHDLTEGVDQLPILQHALNQIWHAADNGKEEMDLIHYAMVGGMPAGELPDDHVDRFNKWFEHLPPHIKACYHKPDLQNVLDTHTNKLYEQAAGYFKEKTGNEISEEDAKSIVKTVFICLTKIDQSRAVRNRMTLLEITNILGRPEFGTKEVGAVLNIFREPGNTFIHPFILDQSGNQDLNEYNVLDITHESLIRNWQYLGQWAKEEFDNYTISLDFEQQLNRWVDSGKSRGFLLPIGPLTYFENWFNKVKPNAYWIARYLPEEIEKENKLIKAKQVLGNAKEFLKRSADRHVVTRTIMRYGPKRIAAALGIIAILVFSSFAVRNYLRKQNDYVLKSIKAESLQIANKPKLSLEFPIPVLNEELIQGNLTIPEIINAIDDPLQKIRIATGIGTQLVMQGRHEPREEIFQCLSIADSLLDKLEKTGNKDELSQGLKLNHDFSITAEYAWFINQNDSLKTLVFNNARRSADWALHIIKEQPEGFTDIQNLSIALDNAINHKIFTADQVSQLLNILSPLENGTRTPWLENNYPKDKLLIRGNLNYGIRYNGLYQDLAYLYAAAGNTDRVLQCVDTILKYQEGFFQNDYATHLENASNIAAVFYTYGTTDVLDDFVRGYCLRKNTDAAEFYNRLVSRALFHPFIFNNANFYSIGGGQIFFNMNLISSSDDMLTFFFGKMREEISKSRNEDEKNFELAVAMKNEGIMKSLRREIRKNSDNAPERLYGEAIRLYQQVSPEYLDQNITVTATGTDNLTMPRRFLFLYPDYRTPFHPWEPRSIIQFYYSSSFIRYVLDHNQFENLYNSDSYFRYFELWLGDYHFIHFFKNWFLQQMMTGELMDRLASKLEERQAGKSADLNILYLNLSEYSFGKNEPEKGIAYLEKIQTEKLLNSFQYINFGVVNSYSLEMVANAVADLTINNRFDLAYKLINVFKKEVNRSSIYGHASRLLTVRQEFPASAKQLLDSAIAEMNRLDNPAAGQPNRHVVATALMFMDPQKNSEKAYSIIKNRGNKFQSIQQFSKAYAFHGNLYQALQQAPALISTGDRSVFLRQTLKGLRLNKPGADAWKTFMVNEPFFDRRFLNYVNEN